MKIAEYFASIGLRVDSQDVAKVDKFLANVGKNLKTSISGTEGLEKAVKKETKTAVDGLEKKAQAQKKVAQQITVTAKNQRAWNKEFAHSLKMMTSKPLSKTGLKVQQGVYDKLFGAVAPKAMMGAVVPKATMRANGANQRAWDTRFKQQLQGMSAGSGISRKARQEQLNAAFGAAGPNPRTQRLLNSRLSYLPGGKSDELSNMAAHYKNEQKIADLKERVRREEEASARRIMELRQRDLERRTRNQQRIERQAAAHQQSLERIQARAASRSAGRSDASYGRANYLHAGGAAGAFARYGVASLPFVGGVYGLGTLNAANQELVSTEIAAGAIFGDRADQAKNWLEEHSDYVGYNYLETMPIFSSFMASSMPLMGYDQSQAVFESLAEFGRTRGADSVGMKRAMTAIQQMASKGQVMQEELKLQLSEAKGFGESRAVFAEANQMRKGGTKTGAEAAKELLDDMGRGEVLAADILPLVAKLYKELAKGGIEEARKSSIAEQLRFQNERTRGLRIFSESGGEEGFARLFKSLAVAMKEALPTVKGLAGAFNTLSKYTSFALLLPQSFKRAFEGRDSWVADAIGEMNAKIIYDLGTGLGDLGSEISKTLGKSMEGWGMLLGAVGPSIANFLRQIKDVLLYSFKMLNAFLPGGGGLSEANNAAIAMRASLNGASPDDVEALARGESRPNVNTSWLYANPQEANPPKALTANQVVNSSTYSNQMSLAKEMSAASNQGAMNVTLNIDGVFRSREEADQAGQALGEAFMKRVYEAERAREYSLMLQQAPLTE